MQNAMRVSSSRYRRSACGLKRLNCDYRDNQEYGDEEDAQFWQSRASVAVVHSVSVNSFERCPCGFFLRSVRERAARRLLHFVGGPLNFNRHRLVGRHLLMT